MGVCLPQIHFPQKLTEEPIDVVCYHQPYTMHTHTTPHFIVLKLRNRHGADSSDEDDDTTNVAGMVAGTSRAGRHRKSSLKAKNALGTSDSEEEDLEVPGSDEDA